MAHSINHIKTRSALLFLLSIALFQSCIDRQNPPDAPLPSPLVPPMFVLLDTAPPPKVHKLLTGPSPRVIPIPKTTRESYTVQDSNGNTIKIELYPPSNSIAESPVATFTTFNTEQGLPLSAVWCSWSDRKGNLWLGTGGGGASRYDGKNFTTYSTTHGLVHNGVWSIIEDKAGNIWFGTRGGLSRYDGIYFKTFNKTDGLSHDDVKCILEDSKGNLWFGTLGGGVSRYDGKSFVTLNSNDGLVDDHVECIEEDGQGNLWFGTSNGVSRYDGSHFTTFTDEDGLAKNDIRSIYSDKKGMVWFGSWGGGVSRYDGNSFTNYTSADGLAHNYVWCIQEDNNGDLWFGTKGGGASRYNGKNFTTYSVDHGLAHNEIMSITMDKQGNLWFATYGAGVCRYDGNSISTLIQPKEITRSVVYHIAEDHTGNLWFGYFGGGISKYDGQYFTLFNKAQGLPNDEIYCITEDRRGLLWIGTNGSGVCSYNGTSFTNLTTAQGLGHNEVTCITEDSKGNLWFGTRGGGVSRFDQRSLTTYKTEQGLANNTVYSILEDKNNNFWFGTENGLSRLDGNSFTTFTTEQGLTHNTIMAIIEDKSHHLWIGTTGGGASRYDGNSFISFSTENGLSDNTVYDIEEDSSGVIWFGTNLGYSSLQYHLSSNIDTSKTLQGAGRVNLSNDKLMGLTPIWESYHVKTGYPIKDLNYNAMCITKVGLPYGDKEDVDVIWGGFGDDKVIRFNPKSIHKNTTLPSVIIQSIKIDETTVSWYSLNQSKADNSLMAQQEGFVFDRKLSKEERDTLQNKFGDIRFDGITPFYPMPQNLKLPYRHNRVTIEFGAVETSRNFMVRYQYILEGYDKEWSPITENTVASYGNIDEGTYLFKVKARSPEGIWSDPVTYTFSVLPPWYRSWWAYGFYLILFGIAIKLLHEYQKKRVIQKEREKTQKREIEHAKEIEKAYTELKSTQAQLIQSEKMASLGQLTAGIAHEIQNPLNFVNNFSEVSNELLDEMKQELVTGNKQHAIEIAEEVKENLDKIIHHGKRADAIVKGMLQHSRTSSGVKEPTDINALCDEYLRLAYHGLRVKDKSFNATMKTDFDPSIGLINIIPQDIGRVLLNLITNAFYAVSTPKSPKGDFPYEPTVTITTRRIAHTHSHPNSHRIGDLEAGKVEISVSDNGPGIPDAIKDKIFQPFFTTKPAGQGTGLGLSLSYDIIKAHGGEITVQSKEGEGTEFIIHLPIGNG